MKLIEIFEGRSKIQYDFQAYKQNATAKEITENIAEIRFLGYFDDMSLLEFTTKIEHGVIHLPKEFEDYENVVAHITVKLENSEEIKAKKDRLFAAFKKLAEVNPFAEIEDPVEWQRKLRDEWD
jgi:hypothetical protein